MGNGIAAPRNTDTFLKRGGSTNDIIEAILDTIPEVRNQTAEFSRQFAGGEPGLKKLYWWVKENITYIEDPLGVQWIREPARLWADRQGDCKSFTVFICSVLDNLGIKYLVRFVNTEKPGSRVVNHVYPVALYNGKEIALDAVYDYYNREHSYYYKKDYNMSEIYRLAGIGNTGTTEADIAKYQAEVLAIASNIPDDVLVDDITQMSQGQYARYMSATNFQVLATQHPDPATAARYAGSAQAIASGSIAGIGNLGGDAAKIQAFLDLTARQTQKAFSAPVLVLPDGLSGVGTLRDKLKNLAESVLNAWKKVVNWVFKMALPVAAPFFLYTFVKGKLKGKSAAKRDKQMKVLAWIQKTGKFDTPDAVKSAVKLGISKAFGNTPENVLKSMARGKSIGRVGVIPAVVAAIASALPMLIDLINKIGGIFKKKDNPPVSAADAPNADELYNDLEEPKTITTATPQPKPDKTPPNDNTMMYVGIAAAAVGIYLVSQSG
jgi:hypothetical protein